MLHNKSVLFLLSLPENKIKEIEEKGINYQLFLQKIRGFSHVEVHETISTELLSKASFYSVVVIIGHQVNECVQLADNSLLPMQYLASALPPSFSGYLHIAICGSTVISAPIKQRCPNSKVRTSDVFTQIELVLLIYTKILIHTDLSKDNFSFWYSKEYNKIMDTQSQKEPAELEKLPFATKLGGTEFPEVDITPSVFAPYEITRSNTFKIQIWLHFDLEKGIVEAKAMGCDPRTKMRDTLATLNNIRQGDEIVLKLCFLDATSCPTELIRVINAKGCKKHVIIHNDLENIIFKIKVCDKYRYDMFSTILEFLKDGKELIAPYEFDTYFKGDGTSYDIKENEKDTEGHCTYQIPPPVINASQIQQCWMSRKAETVFYKAYQKGWIIKHGDGFKWIGFGPKNKKGKTISRTRQLAFLCDEAFRLDNADTPWNYIEQFFGENQLRRDLANVLDIDEERQKWRMVILKFINDIKSTLA